MKDSNCHDPKMVAYYREVHRLEERFDGLKLNHAPRRDNQAADTLAKTMSNRDLVPTGVFASDQHTPLVRYKGSEWANDGPSDLASGASQPTAPSRPEVMEIEQDPVTEPEPLIN